jgi:hypothetical protein
MTSKQRLLKWLFITAMILLGCFFMMKEKGWAESSEYLYEYYDARAGWSNPTRFTNGLDKMNAQTEYDFHMYHAKRTFEDARSKVWFMPEKTWGQRARQVWIAVIPSGVCNTFQSAIVVTLLGLLSQYGVDCADEWDYINEKLTWCQFHLEKCEDYAAIIHGY